MFILVLSFLFNLKFVKHKMKLLYNKYEFPYFEY